MALQILRHAFFMIYRNFGQALRVSVGPYLVLLAGFALFVALFQERLNLLGSPGTLSGADAGIIFLALIGMAIFGLLIFSWVAVSWHRFVLLEEYTGALPALSDRPIGAYAGRSILYALLLVIFAIPLVLVLGPLATIGPLVMQWVVGLALVSVLTFVWLRIALALPSVAVGQPIRMGEAWAASAPLSGAIFGVSVLLVGLSGFADSLSTAVMVAIPVVGVVLNIAIQWLIIMLGVSILTTLYGHLIEKRPLIN
ncbi:hypothetical protein SLH47_12160 [Cognatiyoonia sp. IB215182]|nr:hypothetical protein [Cognatiyoonia sp. IB215182]